MEQAFCIELFIFRARGRFFSRLVCCLNKRISNKVLILLIIVPPAHRNAMLFSGIKYAVGTEQRIQQEVQEMTNREFCQDLKIYHDRICNSILHLDVEWVDVAIQINEMRDFCQENAPDKLPLFEMVYASRFRRLYDTWGRHNEPREWELEEQTWSEKEESWN